MSTCGTAIPKHYVTNNLDCNDNDYYTNSSWDEVPDDGIDNNCDGQIDEGTSCESTETGKAMMKTVDQSLAKSKIVSPALGNELKAMFRRLGILDGKAILDKWLVVIQGKSDQKIKPLLEQTLTWMNRADPKSKSKELSDLRAFIKSQITKNPAAGSFFKDIETMLLKNKKPQGFYFLK